MKGTRTLRAWAGMLGATALAGVPAMGLGLVTLRRWHRSDILPRLFTRLCLRACGVRVVVRGLSRFDPAQNYVMVSNHLSFLDPISIVAVLPQKIRSLAKHEILYFPVFGLAAWATGNIFVKRSKHGSARGSLEKAERAVGRDISLLFFAEGTRSHDGTLGPFKPGASLMALRTGVPVLPMALVGTAELFPRGGRPIRPGTVGLAVGRPIEIDRQSPDDRDALTARIRAAVEALLPEAEEARRTGQGDAEYPPR